MNQNPIMKALRDDDSGVQLGKPDYTIRGSRHGLINFTDTTVDRSHYMRMRKKYPSQLAFGLSSSCFNEVKCEIK